MASAVANVWHRRILAGDQFYWKIPDEKSFKKEVWDLLVEDVKNGVITKEKFEELTREPYPEEE